jgi:Fur family transcriptional regulator, ferric uptake regulator
MNSPRSRETVAVPAEIQQRLERAGLRRTLATRAVLGLFLANPQRELNHAQVFASLAARGLDINRVTLYRLLDRLVACGVLQRHADDDARTWHFCLTPAEAPGQDTRFECDNCHGEFRVSEAREPISAASRELLRCLANLGHAGHRVEVAVHGTCASCLEQGAQA